MLNGKSTRNKRLTLQSDETLEEHFGKSLFNDVESNNQTDAMLMELGAMLVHPENIGDSFASLHRDPSLYRPSENRASSQNQQLNLDIPNIKETVTNSSDDSPRNKRKK